MLMMEHPVEEDNMFPHIFGGVQTASQDRRNRPVNLFYRRRSPHAQINACVPPNSPEFWSN